MAQKNESITSTNNNIFLGSNDISGLYDIKYFSGFYEHIYRDPFIGGNAFIFITRPNLFLVNDKNISNQHKNEYSELALENMTLEPKFTQFLIEERPSELDKSIFNSLSFLGNFSSNFLPMFTNQCKNFEAANTTIDTVDAFDTKQGFKEVLPTHKTASEASNQISISVTEDSNLSFTKLLTLWVNYIANVTDGTFNANPKSINDGILDYTSSIYYFVVGDDGQQLKYWCRYTGCWPTSVPYSSFRYNKGSREIVDMDIPFVYMVKEDMDPMILEDFNILSMKLNSNELNQYSSSQLLNNFQYGSIINNQLLSLQSSPENKTSETKLAKVLKQYAKEENTRYDPLIVYRKNSVESKDYSFYLVFDKYAYTSEFLTSQFAPLLSTSKNSFEYNVFKTQDGPINDNNGKLLSIGEEWNSWAEEIIL